MTTKKPARIPLESLFSDPNFQRNYELLMEESTGNQKLKSAVTSALVNQADQHVELKSRQSTTNAINGSAKKKGVTRKDLETYREQFYYQHGTYRGWVKAACMHFVVTPNTIRARMKENE